jgi:Gluconate 2-dehydrogenase subunit 3
VVSVGPFSRVIVRPGRPVAASISSRNCQRAALTDRLYFIFCSAFLLGLDTYIVPTFRRQASRAVGNMRMYSRREFLIRSAGIAVVFPSGVRVLGFLDLPTNPPSSRLTRENLKLLAAVMDEIIPQSDEMPSASAAGGVAYLEQLGWQYTNVLEEIRDFLRVVQQTSQKELRVEFGALEQERLTAVLKDIEKSRPKLFSSFVAYVYEAYYTRPQVQGLLSCSVPSVPREDEESLLAPVQRLTRLYREVP